MRKSGDAGQATRNHREFHDGRALNKDRVGGLKKDLDGDYRKEVWLAKQKKMKA